MQTSGQGLQRKRRWRWRRAVTAHAQKYPEPTARKENPPHTCSLYASELQMLTCQYNFGSGKEVEVYGGSSPWKDFSAKKVVHVKATPVKAQSPWKTAAWLTSPWALLFPSLLAHLPAHTPLLSGSFWGLSFICLSTGFCGAHPEQGWHVSYYHHSLEAKRRGGGDGLCYLYPEFLAPQTAFSPLIKV